MCVGIKGTRVLVSKEHAREQKAAEEAAAAKAESERKRKEFVDRVTKQQLDKAREFRAKVRRSPDLVLRADVKPLLSRSAPGEFEPTPK
eukprot:158069-Prorocentrum_minimum.AAC.1